MLGARCIAEEGCVVFWFCEIWCLVVVIGVVICVVVVVVVVVSNGLEQRLPTATVVSNIFFVGVGGIFG